MRARQQHWFFRHANEGWENIIHGPKRLSRKQKKDTKRAYGELVFDLAVSAYYDKHGFPPPVRSFRRTHARFMRCCRWSFDAREVRP